MLILQSNVKQQLNHKLKKLFNIVGNDSVKHLLIVFITLWNNEKVNNMVVNNSDGIDFWSFALCTVDVP